MIIETEADVTRAVLAGVEGAPDARTREILAALVKHLHGFIREVKLTEREFHAAAGFVNAIGRASTASHNEAMLLAGALGVSNLVTLLNNGARAGGGTDANLLGPFWRADAPRIAHGGSLVRSPVPGDPLVVSGFVRDAAGRAVEGAEIDVWQSSPAGLYENQDPGQAELNLRGVLVTQADGSFRFTSVKPGPYPVPTDGPAGLLLAAQRRKPWRPAHLHFMIYKPGYKTICSQLYSADDPNLETDSQFGVTRALVAHYERTADGFALEHTFVIEPGEARRPPPPISAKVEREA